MRKFCDSLSVSAKRETPASQKLSIARAPDPVYRAYVDLVSEAFLYFRSVAGQEIANQDEVRDLADALHNISGILGDYGCWIDDVKYREMFLRRYDDQWATGGFGLVRYIEERVAYYAKKMA